MATYRVFPATNGPATATSYTGNFISGIVFQSTQSNTWFEGYWWWVCGSGQSTSPVECALWSASGAGTGTLVSGSVVTSGTLTAGQWNYIPLPTPIQLPLGGSMVAAIGCNGSFPDTNSFWANGSIANGPLYAFGTAQADGGTSYYNGGTAEPWGVHQGCFSTAGSDPSTTIPMSASGTDNFWVDVQISDTAPAGYPGSYRLWPNLAAADAVTGIDDNQPYILATEIHLSQSCDVNWVWFYSPSVATSLPTAIDIWSIGSPGTGGTNVATNAAPSWLTSAGSAASAGDGWIKASIGSVTLPAGQYKVSVYDANGSGGSWGAKRLSYWGVQTGNDAQSAIGINGITTGPMFAPATASAATSFSYGNETQTEPGQSTFQVGPPNQYPNLYVGANSPGGDLFQNYWVDLEVTPSAAANSSGLLLTFLP